MYLDANCDVKLLGYTFDEGGTPACIDFIDIFND